MPSGKRVQLFAGKENDLALRRFQLIDFPLKGGDQRVVKIIIGDLKSIGHVVLQSVHASQPHPARKQSPPSGVTAPSQRVSVSASKYKLPEKIIMPAVNNQR